MQRPLQLQKLYQLILSAQSTLSVTKNEKLLTAMHSHPQFLQTNLTLVLTPSFHYNIRRLAALEMRRYGQRLIEMRNVDSLRRLASVLIQLLGSIQLEFGLKQLLMKAIFHIFSAQESKDLQLEFLQTVDQMMQSTLQKIQNINFIYYGFCIQLAIIFKSQVNHVNTFIKAHFENFARLAHLLLLKILENPSISEPDHILSYKAAAIYGRALRSMLNRVRLMQQTTNQLLFSPVLSQVVTIAFRINLPDNSLDTPLFMIHRNEGLALAFNEFKIVYFNFLQLFLRTANGFIRDQNLLLSNPLINFSFSLLQNIISTLSRMFDEESMFTWNVESKLVEAAYQLMKILNCALRINSIYYNFFNQHKATINQKIILRCLLLSQQETALFEQYPEEFAQRSLQITGRKMDAEGQDNDDFDMLKCVAANCLVVLCTMQDGAASHLFDYALSSLQGKISSKYPGYIFYQAMAILANTLKGRVDLKEKVINFIQKQCCDKINIDDAQLQGMLNYFYFLVLITKVAQIQPVSEDVAKSLFKLAEETLMSGCQAMQYIAHELLTILVQMGLKEENCYQIIYLYHSILQQRRPAYQFLSTYQALIKGNKKILEKRKEIVLIGIRLIGDYIIHEVSNNTIDTHFLFLCFNIISEFGQKYIKIPETIDGIEKILLPLAKYCEAKNDFDFQDDLFSLLTMFIKQRKQVNLVQLRIIDSIPKIYYNQYCEVFGQMFETLQAFIYYGSKIMEKVPQILNALVKIGLNSLIRARSSQYTQVDACAGACLLQSMLIVFWKKLPSSLLSAILKALINKLEMAHVNNFLNANLLGLLSLALAQFIDKISYEDGTLALQKLLNCSKYFVRVEYAPKVMIVGMSELLLLENPLVKQHFGSIFATIVSILCYEHQKRDISVDQDQVVEEEDVNYSQLIDSVVNNAKEMDEFSFFKRKIQQLRQQNGALLQHTISSLSINEKETLTQILRIERVQKTARAIYKTK